MADKEKAILYYERVGEGVRVDKKKALSLFERAAAKDHATALFNLGLMYYYGDDVETVDKKKAIELLQPAASKCYMYHFERAAAKGNESAMNNLAV